VLFGRGSLFYLLRNRFYVGEVKYKNEILPGEQPAIVDRALFDAVQQKLSDQWSHRNHNKTRSHGLLTGLLFDDAGHRMVPTHATKAGIRYRYYASLPHLKGESKITLVGSVSRVAASEIEDAVVTALNQHLVANIETPNSNGPAAANCNAVRETIERVDVAADRLTITLRPGTNDERNRDAADRHSFSIPWQKVPSRKSRQILIPHGVPRDQVRPTRMSAAPVSSMRSREGTAGSTRSYRAKSPM
jgi:site-specific DNA recombinase